MPRRVPDISKIGALIGYRPTRSLDQILESVIAYLPRFAVRRRKRRTVGPTGGFADGAVRSKWTPRAGGHSLSSGLRRGRAGFTT